MKVAASYPSCRESRAKGTHGSTLEVGEDDSWSSRRNEHEELVDYSVVCCTTFVTNQTVQGRWIDPLNELEMYGVQLEEDTWDHFKRPSSQPHRSTRQSVQKLIAAEEK